MDTGPVRMEHECKLEITKKTVCSCNSNHKFLPSIIGLGKWQDPIIVCVLDCGVLVGSAMDPGVLVVWFILSIIIPHQHILLLLLQ